ncbi:MAG TPA: enoyl-CoA hydratase/isomerase family protein [Cryptosporangiaceae bacterium]|nr:enoyl-CoA hydratase/isomerase family protein [Cryptosporangiaceae bacterium]
MSGPAIAKPLDWETAGVDLDTHGAVATVSLSRPEALNAQTPATWRVLAEIGRTLPGTVRVVVVRGEGRAFSAGLDRALFAGGSVGDAPSLMQMARMSAAECERLIDAYQAGFRWLRRPDLVSIAAVQGHAVGAGFQLALACDLRVVADDVQFSMPETTLGLVPDLGGTKPLVDLVGVGRAMEICLTGRRVGAEEAAQIGLANAVVTRRELDAAVADLVCALIASPRDAVVETKMLLRTAAGRTHAQQEAAERASQARRLRDLAGLGE